MLDEYITLDFDQTSRLAESQGACRFILEHSGSVGLTSDDGEKEAIGRFKAFYLDLVSAVNEDKDAFYVFDAYQETAGYINLYDVDLDFTSATVKAIGADPLWAPNLLILDRLVIEPGWRGAGRGLVALRGLIEALRPGAGIVAMKPFPLQSESNFMRDVRERERLRLDDFPSDQRLATAALRRYYARLGFAKVAGSDFMVLDPQRRLESSKALTRPRTGGDRSATK